LKLKNTKFINVYKPVSLRYIYHIITSKYLMFGNREIRWVDLNKQIVISLTHGIPIKSCKGMFPKTETFNYLLATSKNVIPIIANEYCASEEKCFIADLPRNDLLFQNNNQVEELLKDYRKVIVWLPTYKKHKNANITDIDRDSLIPLLNEEELNKLNKQLLKNNSLLILKFHPAEDVSKLKSQEYDNIRILTQEEFNKLDIHLYSLLAYTDALITDYSSVSLDYILLDRPIGYVLDDVKEYKDKRGFCVNNIEDVIAGCQIKSSRDLFAFIDEICKNIDNYKAKRTKVLDFYHDYKDKNICEIIAKKFDL